MSNLLTAKKEIVNNRATYGVDIGDIYYHYETIGSVNWGMKKFVVTKVDTGCMCNTPFYVDLQFTDNKNELSTHHVNSEDLKQYSCTEKQAWEKYYEYCSKEIQRHYTVIDSYKQSQIEAIQKISELEAKEEV